MAVKVQLSLLCGYLPVDKPSLSVQLWKWKVKYLKHCNKFLGIQIFIQLLNINVKLGDCIGAESMKIFLGVLLYYFKCKFHMK
jgi:hypothetical protein